MKSFGLIVLSVILSVTATPLGDRQVARRHNGIALSRRYVLESRTTAPAACVAAPPPASGTAAVPDPSVADPTATDPTATDPTATDPTATDVPVPDAGNSTDPSVAPPVVADNSTAVAAPADNSTVADNSTATAAPAASRRFWARHGFSSGFDSSSEFDSSSSFDFDFSEIDSFSFEEVTTSFVSTWESLCLESGGDIFTNDPCNTFGGDRGYSALLETADVCDQQIIADSMITFAKSRGIRNRDDLIHFALSYRRHPRRSVEILGVVPSSLYCLDTPDNSELVGVYQEQLQGCNPGVFGSPSIPLTSFGSSGTCPSGMTADVSTCGCLGSDGTTDISDGLDMSSDSTDSADSTDSSASTDSSDTSDSTDSTDPTATSTDTADASLSTDASSTDSASTATSTDDSVAPPPPSATDVEAQPSDISGNVNDPNGRR